MSDTSGNFPLTLTAGNATYSTRVDEATPTNSTAKYPYTGTKALSFSSTKYSLTPITLSKNSDWTFESLYKCPNDIALLGTDTNASNIYVNLGFQGIRLRYSTSEYVDLFANSGDFNTAHVWKLAYNSTAKTITLYRDGTFMDSKPFNADLTFNQVGMSGTTGTTNNAQIDYIDLRQAGLNSGANVIRFDFNDSLSDNSKNYSLALVSGTTAYSMSDIGYTISPSNSLALASPMVLPNSQSYNISFKASFDQNMLPCSLFGSAVQVKTDGIYFGTNKLGGTIDQLINANQWNIVCTSGVIKLLCNGEEVAIPEASKVAPASVTLQNIGGSSNGIMYSFSVSKYFDKPAMFNSNISSV